jgi:hypothetical protein
MIGLLPAPLCRKLHRVETFRAVSAVLGSSLLCGGFFVVLFVALYEFFSQTFPNH